jgi:hypothetical protein
MAYIFFFFEVTETDGQNFLTAIVPREKTIDLDLEKKEKTAVLDHCFYKPHIVQKLVKKAFDRCNNKYGVLFEKNEFLAFLVCYV